MSVIDFLMVTIDFFFFLTLSDFFLTRTDVSKIKSERFIVFFISWNTRNSHRLNWFEFSSQHYFGSWTLKLSAACTRHLIAKEGVTLSWGCTIKNFDTKSFPICSLKSHRSTIPQDISALNVEQIMQIYAVFLGELFRCFVTLSRVIFESLPPNHRSSILSLNAYSSVRNKCLCSLSCLSFWKVGSNLSEGWSSNEILLACFKICSISKTQEESWYL